jgi:hypothetical protein
VLPTPGPYLGIGGFVGQFCIPERGLDVLMAEALANRGEADPSIE